MFWILSIIALVALLGLAVLYDRHRAKLGQSHFSDAALRALQGRADSAGGGGWAPRGGGS